VRSQICLYGFCTRRLLLMLLMTFSDFVESISCEPSESCQVRGSNPCRDRPRPLACRPGDGLIGLLAPRLTEREIRERSPNPPTQFSTHFLVTKEFRAEVVRMIRTGRPSKWHYPPSGHPFGPRPSAPALGAGDYKNPSISEYPPCPQIFFDPQSSPVRLKRAASTSGNCVQFP
jgi:hypothetical protein